MSPFEKPLGLQQPTRACMRRLTYPARPPNLCVGSRRVLGAWRCRSATGDVVGEPAQTNGSDEPHPDNAKDKDSTSSASSVTVDVEHVHVPPPASSTSTPDKSVSPGAAPDTADWIASHPVDWDGKPDTGVKEPDASGVLDLFQRCHLPSGPMLCGRGRPCLGTGFKPLADAPPVGSHGSNHACFLQCWGSWLLLLRVACLQHTRQRPKNTCCAPPRCHIPLHHHRGPERRCPPINQVPR